MARGGEGPDVEGLDVLTDEELATPPPRPPWRAPTWALPDPGADPAIYGPASEHYNDAPRGSLPPVGNLPDSWGPDTCMNHNNYRTTVITLTTRLPFAFGWLVGDGHRPRRRWWRVGGILSLQRGHDPGGDREADGGLPHVGGHPPPTQTPATGTACPAAARPAAAAGHVRQCGSGQDDGQRYPARRLTLLLPENRDITTPRPRSRATTATRAMNVRARAPSTATSSTSSGPSTPAPPTPVATPHQQRAADATRTTDAPAPSRAGTPQSPQQERASKRAAQRHPPQRHAATGIQGHRASAAGSRAVLSAKNTAAVGTRPEQPPGTAHPHREPTPSPTGNPQPQTPPGASAHGHQPAASHAAATQAHPEPRRRHGTAHRPAAGPAYAPPEDPLAQAHAATPTDAATTRPSDIVRPHDPTVGLDPRGSGNVQHGGPAGHDTRRTGAPATPRPTNQAEGAARRTVISRSPGPRPGPRTGPGTHHRPGGRPAARRPWKPTRAAARVGRPRPMGSATGER